MGGSCIGHNKALDLGVEFRHKTVFIRRPMRVDRTQPRGTRHEAGVTRLELDPRNANGGPQQEGPGHKVCLL